MKPLKVLCSTCCVLLFFALCPSTIRAEEALLQFGGCGGVYFLAEPGDFLVEVEKRDLRKGSRNTILRAILTGPDRAVIGDEYLPGDGKVRLNTRVMRKGLYVLNVTVSGDRYGEHIAWGFRSNCPRYLIETSRGHRDAPHEEPLVLLSPESPGDICFLPERKAFSIEVAKFPGESAPLTLLDATGEAIATLQPDETGAASAEIPAGTDRSAVPWRLHLPVFQGTVHIDGLTRWSEQSDFPNLSLWTPDPESWFPFHENRWPIFPYSRKVYAQAGEKGAVAYQIHNNAFVDRRFAIELEFPDQPWEIEVSEGEITLAPGETMPVQVHYTVPGAGESWTAHLRVTPVDSPDFSTYAALSLIRGDAPAGRPLDMPLVLKPYAHENEQFGYLPEYPLDNQVYFDGDGRPYIASSRGVHTCRENDWIELRDVLQTDGETGSFRMRSTKVAFDTSNNVYLIGGTGGATALLYMEPGGEAFKTCELPGRAAFDIEQFSGHNRPEGPPPLARYTLTARDPNVFWRRVNDLDLFLPERDAAGVVKLGEPIPITKLCIGFSAHSGIPSSLVSRGDKVHVVWAEATDPEEKVPGVPTFVATYDRSTKTLSAPAFVGHGPPANDVHNTPCITMDSRGYLHVLVGTHGRTFQYARSLQPNDAGGGWTEAEELGPGLRQTYVGLVCGPDDTLHVAFRLWRDDRDYFPASHYATLAYMSKRPGEGWSEARPLIVPPFSEYSVFYHRLTIDQSGRLFLSYDYWSTYWFYRSDHRGSRRALMMSPDGGKAWRMAGLEHLLQR